MSEWARESLVFFVLGVLARTRSARERGDAHSFLRSTRNTRHSTAGPEHAERLIRWLGEAGLWGEALRLLHEYEEEAATTAEAAGEGGGGAALAPPPPPAAAAARAAPRPTTTKAGSAVVSGATAAMYRGALRACALAGRGEEARALVSQMAGRGHAVTEAEPAMAMDALANGGRPLEALEVLAQLQRGEFALSLGVAGPGLACYNAALKAWAAAGRAAEAVALLGHMYASPQAPAPDVASFNTALLACARQGDWRLALDLVRLMERLNHQQPASSPSSSSSSSSAPAAPPRLLNTTTAAASASACSAPIAVGIWGSQHQQQQPPAAAAAAAAAMAAPQQQQPPQPQHPPPPFVPSSPLSAPLLLSSGGNGNGLSDGDPPASAAGPRVPPSLVTYNTLLQSLVKAQPPQPLLALGLFESLCGSACPYLAPDAISFNLAIIAAGQGNTDEGWRCTPQRQHNCLSHPFL